MRFAALLFTILTVVSMATPASARDDDNPDPTDETGTGGSNSGGPPPYVQPTEGFNWKAPNRFSRWDEAWRPQGWLRDWAVETYDRSRGT